MVATFPSCSRTNVMPVFGSDGAKVSVAGSPENNPGPSSETSREMVFCNVKSGQYIEKIGGFE